MDKIIVSDTALIGSNYQDTKDGIRLLKQFQKDGCKIIILSNRPELCMRKIGAYINPDSSISYRYLGACDKKGNGIDFIIHNDTTIHEEYNIKPDFSIFGNGIAAFGREDNLIYQGDFLTSEQLNEMIQFFKAHGYRSYKEYASLSQDSFGDRCFQGREDVYKFFTPEIGSDSFNNRTYGMQCSSRGTEEDEAIVAEVERKMPEIAGYVLNGKPCFYQKRVNKLVALNSVLNQYGLNISESLIVLCEKTDKVILQQYPNLSNCVGDLEPLLVRPKEPNSLAKVLKKVR